MEIIETLRHSDRSPAQHFAIAAITKYAGVGVLELPLHIELKINGVDIPFTDALTDIYSRFEKQAEQSVAERADMVALLSTEEGLKQEARKLAAEMCRNMADKFQWDED